MGNKNIRNLVITWHEQDPAELLTQVGEWLEEQGYLNQAIVFYEAALKLNPIYSLASYRAGKLALHQQQYTYAIQKLEYSLQFIPDHAPTHYLLSLAYMGLGDIEKALTYANNTLCYNPQHMGAFLQKLRILAKLNKWKEIVNLCQELLVSSLQEAKEIYLWYALAETHLGNLDKARTLYSKVSARVRRRYPEVSQQIETKIFNRFIL